MYDLPNRLYKVASILQLEQVAINAHGISAYELMQRAGTAVFRVIQQNYSHGEKILILCGAGNNAGDGYVVAKLAKQAGYAVQMVSLVNPDTLTGAAQHAYQDCVAVVEMNAVQKNTLSVIDDAALIVDALLGTGLTRDVSAEWAKWIDAVNQSSAPVIAVDIPSGLMADTGCIAGRAIQADITVCFIGLKQGMFTAQGKDVCGDIVFDDLSLPEEVYCAVKNDALLVNKIDYSLLPKRKPSSHKGCFGHVLIVGGNEGMPGAVILAARAALRTGAGLVSIITATNNIEVISSAVPEAMIRGCGIASIETLFKETFVSAATHVAVGMGLGQDAWSEKLLQHCVQLNKPLLIDADGLNLLAKLRLKISSELIITPHPGEASRLLGEKLFTHKLLHQAEKINSVAIQRDRFDAIRKIHALFKESASCVAILKGSGTLIFDGQTITVCDVGSPAMAAPGMGDVLSGILIALMAQQAFDSEIALAEIATLGVCLHATAAELAIAGKTRGLLASDVVDKLPEVLL